MKLRIALCIALVCSALLFHARRKAEAAPQEKCEEQKPDEPFSLPVFKAKDFTTGRMIRSADFKGRLMIINFWFSGCPSCRWEAPSFRKLAEENRDIAVIAMTNPRYNPGDSLKKFVDRFGWRFPVLLIDDTIHDSFYPNDEYYGYPATFLINKKGEVVGKIENYVDWDTPEMKDVLANFRNGKLIWYHRILARRD